MDYGKCEDCGCNLEPIWFLEEETIVDSGCMYKTGRVRRAVSHLVCPVCLHNYCVDDTFDGTWRQGKRRELNV